MKLCKNNYFDLSLFHIGVLKLVLTEKYRNNHKYKVATFQPWTHFSLVLLQEISKMNFLKIIILPLVLSLQILAVNSAISKRRMNLLRKFHNDPKSKINKSNFVSSNRQATKNKIMILSREQKIIELHRKIKIMLNDREKNRLKLFY